LDKRLTLSEQTKKVARSLDTPIKFTVFYDQGTRWNFDDIFQQLRYCNRSMVSYELIDLDRNPGRARLSGITHYGQTIAETSTRTIKTSYPTEEQILNTILKLTRKKVKKILFSTGHAEHGLNDGEESGYSKLKKALETEDWQVEEVVLGNWNNPGVTDSVLVVAGPKKDFLDQEVGKMRDFIERGGRAVFMLEPHPTIPGLIHFLSSYGFILPDDIVVDFEQKLSGGDWLTPYVYPYKVHPIASDLESPCLFSSVRPIAYDKNQEEKNAVSCKPLCLSSQTSIAVPSAIFAKQGLDALKPGAESGSIPVGAICEAEPRSKNTDKGLHAIVCLGDSDFINNSFLDLLSNKDLFFNIIDYLIQERLLQTARPKGSKYEYHLLSSREAMSVFWSSLVVMPGIFLLIAVVLFVKRRKGNAS
jgi:hypothetical protein